MASGTFNYSLVEAEAQLLLAVLGDDLNAQEAVLRPRFGTAPYDFKAPNSPADWSKNWIDPAFPKDVKTRLEQRGLSFVPGDTGIGSVILRNSDGTLEGAVSPYPPLDAAAVVLG